MQKYGRTIQLLNDLVDDRIVPGMSWVIFDRDTQLQAVRGLAQWRPEPEVLTDQMQFDLASLTKVVGTVPLMLQLWQEGYFKMDQPVTAFLPELGSSKSTIRNLFTHSSDIGGWIPHRDELNAQQLTAALLKTQEVGPSVGKKIHYADVNFIYLGWIAERILHQPVHRLIEQRVLAPLRMSASTFQPEVNRAVPTSITKSRGLIRGTVHDPKGYVLGAHCGSAGLFSTAADLTHFGRLLIEDNLGGLLTSQTVDQLFTDQTPLSGEHLRSFGWKLHHSRTNDHHLVICHTGYTGTLMILDRVEDQGLILLTNRVHPRPDNQEFIKRRGQLMAAYLAEKNHPALG
ncbi:MAG TPA: beta-lactamase family protein [Candidatus Limosilactobacillus merdipullorum]|uniref:Beta-lactamase family protein n=1 Tax=Candidatus Limosilactobacillus merdipullorum TaxID=2838653 RepID=A0A9D1QQ37_9LACO|nr:beta-lactamase family protein [Candidatus Limosilactobacillus merdipullorum]